VSLGHFASYRYRYRDRSTCSTFPAGIGLCALLGAILQHNYFFN